LVLSRRRGEQICELRPLSVTKLAFRSEDGAGSTPALGRAEIVPFGGMPVPDSGREKSRPSYLGRVGGRKEE